MPAFLAYASAGDRGIEVMSAQPSASELVADGSTSTIEAGVNNFARVSATSDVYVAFGAAPNAGVEPRHFLQAGQSFDFGNLRPGWTMAVVAA